MNKKPNVLLTGATGFLGSHLLPRLINENYDVIILKRSFDSVCKIKKLLSRFRSYDLDAIDIEDVFKGNRIDVIVHIATDYGKDIFDGQNRVIRLINANIEFPARLLELASRYKIRYFINTHTASHSKYLFYSATKNAFLEIAYFYSANYDFKFVNMIIEYIYGENDDDIKFIPSVINKILNGEKIEASGGEQERDFIYVGDVVNAYMLLLSQMDKIKESHTEFNVGTGNVMSFKSFVEKIEEAIGSKALISWGVVPYRKNELFYSKADISRINKILGWHPEISLDQGLLNTVHWYRNHRKDNK